MAKTITKEPQAELFRTASPRSHGRKIAKPAASSSAAIVPAKAPPPQNMLAVIANAAANPKVNPDAMRALLDMQKEIMAEESRIAFITALHDMRSHLPVINKDGKIVIPPKDGKRGQQTPYATFENIMEQVEPILQKFGFVLTFQVSPTADGSRINIRAILSHIRGHERFSDFPLPAETSGSKNNVQGWGSSFSYGKRYSTIAVLNIRTRAAEDRDTDGHVEPSTITAEEIDILRQKMKAAGLSEADFCVGYKIDRIQDLPAKDYDDATMRVLNYGKRKHGTAG